MSNSSPRSGAGRQLLARVFMLGAVLSVGLPTCAHAAPESGLAELVDARSRAFAAPLADAERVHADAWRDRSRRWLAGAPEFQASYRRGDWNRSDVAFESQLGLSVALATPAQRGAARQLSQTEVALAAINRQRRRLAWAGVLRQSYWRTVLAQATAAAAREELSLRKQWHASVLRRVEAGDAAANEALLTERERMLAQAALEDAKALLQASRSEWVELSGDDQLPHWPAEQLHTPEQVHPDIRAARLQVTRLRRQITWIRAQAGVTPRVGVSWFREEVPAAAARDDSAVLSLAIPLGGKRFSSTEQARLAVDAENAALHLAQMERRQRIAVEHARTAYDTAVARLAPIEAAARASRKFAQSVRRAHALGEADLLDVTRALARDQELQLQQKTAQIRVAQQAAHYNQTVGYIE